MVGEEVKSERIEWTDERNKKHIKTENTNFRKRCNYHQFRHSRASLLASKMTESALCKYMGWELGSSQVRRYVHLSPEQTENAYLKAMGIEVVKEAKQEPLQLNCDCGTVNDNTSRYCRTCGKPLTVAIAITDQDLIKTEMDKSIKLLMEIAKNPELMRQFEEFKNGIKK